MRKVTNRRRRGSERIAGQENLTVTLVAVADQKKSWSHSPTVLCLHRASSSAQANETVEGAGGTELSDRIRGHNALSTGTESRPVTAFVFIERREATSRQSQTRTVRYALYVLGKAYFFAVGNWKF